ncbi:hypothetical protein OKW29_001929 [Paraburkholderia sp. CI3]
MSEWSFADAQAARYPCIYVCNASHEAART